MSNYKIIDFLILLSLVFLRTRTFDMKERGTILVQEKAQFKIGRDSSQSE